MDHQHPYNPPDLTLPFTYHPPTTPLPQILATVAAVPILTTSITLFILSQTRPNAPLFTKARACWFTICLTTHHLLETPLLLTPAADFFSHPYSLPATLWLEYAQSDSRYLHPRAHPVLYLTELITITLIAFFNWLALYGLLRSKTHLELVGTIATSALYCGTVSLYFLDAVLGEEGVWGWCREEGVYRWVYFVGMNAVWGVVPVGLLVWAGGEVRSVVREVEVLRRRVRERVPEVRRESVGGTETVLIGKGVRRVEGWEGGNINRKR